MIRNIDPYELSKGNNIYTFIGKLSPYMGYIFNVYKKDTGEKIVDKKILKRIEIEDLIWLKFEFYKTILIVEYSEKLNKYSFEVIEPEMRPSRSDIPRSFDWPVDTYGENNSWEFDMDSDYLNRT